MIEFLRFGREIELMGECCTCWCSCKEIYTHCDHNHNEWLPGFKVLFPED